MDHHLAQLNVGRLVAAEDSPVVAEAAERLEHLREHGPTPYAFTFRTRFEAGSDRPQTADERDSCPA